MDVGAGQLVTGLAQRPDDARGVRRPGLVRAGGQVGDAQVDGVGGDVGRVQAQDAVVAPGDGRDGLVRQGEGHDEAVVVVGVLADEVHPARRRPHPLRLRPVQLPEPLADGPRDSLAHALTPRPSGNCGKY